MTILPHKSKQKEKNGDPETTEHKSHSHHPSTHNGEGSRGTHSRSRNPASRDNDVMSPHDPGGPSTQELGACHNKRRHRTSPHRTGRKYRTCIPSISKQSLSSSASFISPNTSPSGYNSGDEHEVPAFNSSTNIEELEIWFERTIKEEKGFIIKKMAQDGACLFRAVADQVYGDEGMHSVVRKHCLDYMAKNSDYFKQYITEDFTMYLNRKRMDHCHGNHIEMQAIGEMYNRAVEVYQYSLEPINTFHGSYKTDNAPIRISYHRGVHYNSVVDPWGATIGVGLGLPEYQPGMADKNLVKDAMRQSEDFHIEKTMLEDKMRETDWEVTQEMMQEQVARESYLQWLRDQEKIAKRPDNTKSASATCSSSCDPDCTLTWLPETRRDPPSHSGQLSPRPSASLEVAVSSSAERIHPFNVSRSPTLSVAAPVSSSAATCSLYPEDSSYVGFYSQLYEMNEWDEDELLARAIAESQRDYLNSLKKNANSQESMQSSSGEATTSFADLGRNTCTAGSISDQACQSTPGQSASSSPRRTSSS